jgi:hypothetical protein
MLNDTLLGSCRLPMRVFMDNAASSSSADEGAFCITVRLVLPDRSRLACLVLLPDAGDRTSKPDVCRRRLGLWLTGASSRVMTDALRERASSASRSLSRASWAMEPPPTQTDGVCELSTGTGGVVGLLCEMRRPQTVGVLLSLISSSSCTRKVRSGTPTGRRAGVAMLDMMLMRCSEMIQSSVRRNDSQSVMEKRIGESRNGSVKSTRCEAAWR